MGRKPRKRKSAVKKTTASSNSSIKWYLVSFYFSNGNIETIRYSATMLPEEYSDMLSVGKHSKVRQDGCTIYIDEFNSEKACKDAQDDATLVDSVFKIVEEDDKKEAEAANKKSEEEKEEQEEQISKEDK